ncbi:DNA-methyltransferase [Microbacterium telephonicum]|uniref:Site-specific DNA-methyltransferase (Adenine-specific) n=1 Tax=Microbacterium telephonicum TaxID=1714841 RepID=A0A498CJQ9_9MICO|nr:site-specific DNA-methyltransferase [Microbacterium telephonicum]RLK52441.1 site-specific DNA-methyltransferase (adenine-specific) [Microbacterium telephonicum]
MTDLVTDPGPVADASPGRGRVEVRHGDNLAAAAGLESGAFTLVYLDPPFNTGRVQSRAVERAFTTPEIANREASGPGAQARNSGDAASEAGGAHADLRSYERAPVKNGFRGTSYARLRGDLRVYDDRFDDYWDFLEPRLREAWRLLADDGTLYLHLDYREAHYAKVLLDALVGRDKFLNELIWAYDYGAKSRRRWPTKHDTILVYVKDPTRYWFDSDAVDREPYMAPGLVTPEKAARGKLPTDVWWHTIVPTSGREKTGYPTQKPEGILRRIVQASSRPGDRVLDLFAGSGTTGAVAAALGRDAVLVDASDEAVGVMRRRIPDAVVTRV